tara:strand:- start:1580 stop:2371 length:792 start_codon:yes stop_codon:yes gene_type:complete
MTRARDFADVISGNFAIPSGSLGNAVPADGSITTAKLADDAITSAKIADDAVVAAAIADNAVVSASIANDAVTSAKLDTNIDIAGTLDSTGAITADAGLTLPSGQGINFSATSNTGVTGASMVGELFDDYETGTWTPVIGGSTTTGTASYSTQAARYTKVGNLVTVIGYVNWSNLNGTGNLVIYNIPFITSETGTNYEGLAAVSTMHSNFSLGSGYTDVCLYYPAYSSNNYLFFYATGPSKSWANVGIQGNAQIIFTFTYTTD